MSCCRISSEFPTQPSHHLKQKSNLSRSAMPTKYKRQARLPHSYIVYEIAMLAATPPHPTPPKVD
eukprot:2186560-Pleurochrysis_carterae.AAC.2